jgi:hypothetical protein
MIVEGERNKREKGKNIHSVLYRYFSLSLALMIVFSCFLPVISVKANPLGDDNVFTTKVHFQRPSLVDVQMNNTTFTQVVMPNSFLQTKPGDPALPERFEYIHKHMPYTNEFSFQVVWDQSWNNKPLYIAASFISSSQEYQIQKPGELQQEPSVETTE